MKPRQRRWLLPIVVLGALLGAGFAIGCAAAEYGDLVMKRKTPGMDDIPPSIFPHWIHRMQFKCGVCHEEIFKLKVGATENVTMDAINAGKTCGACHNAKAAFEANFDTCPRCHRQ